MADKSKIGWTEATWNPVTGCTKVSQGCKHCYAEQVFNKRLATNPKLKRYYGRTFTDVQSHDELLDKPLHWKKPRMIFVNSMSDLFHEDVPFEFIKKVWDTMFDTSFEPHRHIYQILTKRPARMLEFSKWMGSQFQRIDYDNVWLGVSVEDQKTADERIPILLQTPAAIRWISAEPLLEKIDIMKFIQLDWVVVGGESGHRRRKFDIDWARKLRDDCKVKELPFFMKQVDKVIPIPEDLLIREYPK